MHRKEGTERNLGGTLLKMSIKTNTLTYRGDVSFERVEITLHETGSVFGI